MRRMSAWCYPCIEFLESISERKREIDDLIDSVSAPGRISEKDDPQIRIMGGEPRRPPAEVLEDNPRYQYLTRMLAAHETAEVVSTPEMRKLIRMVHLDKERRPDGHMDMRAAALQIPCSIQSAYRYRCKYLRIMAELSGLKRSFGKS